MKTPWEILMVEDSATDAELALRAFKHGEIANPLRIVTSGDQGLDYLVGPSALAKVGPVRPQLILLDLNLPGMSGIEFLRRIKADERTRDIPVVVLSLSEKDSNIMACVRLGSDGYIVKPLDIDNLARVTAKLNLPLTLVPSPVIKIKTKAI